MTSCVGRSLRASMALVVVFALILAFAQVAAAQDSGGDPASDPFSVGGLTDTIVPNEGSTTSAGATIASDESDYAPGSLVTLTGSGWQPGESVRIVVNDDGLQEQPWQRDVTVIAAADGTIGDVFDLPQWFVANYTVTATGESGTATTAFTDAIEFGGCHSSAGPNVAGTITVDTTTDEFDNTANATCSLREAIRTANGTGSGESAADTIILPAGIYTLTIGADGDDNSVRGDLDAFQPVTIQGAGARTTVIQAGTDQTNGIDRVFDLRNDGVLTMSGVTVRNGRIGDDGAGFRVRGSNAGLNLTDVTVANNTVTAGNRDGAGIHSTDGPIALNRVTVSGNASGRDGGGIFTSGVTSVTNVTLTNNSAAGNGTGGAFRTAGASLKTLTNVTVSHNSTAAGGAGAGIARQGSGAIQLRNTIVANNSVGATANANCDGGVTNTSTNLDSGTTCGFGVAASNAAVNLGPLQNNGGPTDTRALGAGSAGIDTGTTIAGFSTDQRNITRPQGTAWDIGAFEASTVTLTNVNGNTVTFPYLTKDDVTSVGGSCLDALGAVSVTVNSSPTAPATATCSGGSWTLTLTTALSDDGEFTFEASQVGAIASGGKKVTIDQTPPVVTLTKVNGTTRTFPYFTNQNVTSVGGSCTDGDGDVAVTLGGVATAPATATCSSGSWSLTLTTALSAENSYTFEASQKDQAGNVGSSGNKVVTIDKTAPVVTLDEVNGTTRTFPYFTNQDVTSVGGSCTNGDGPVSVTVGGNPTAPATATCSAGSWTLTLTTALSAESSYTFAASQADAAGNTGGSGNKVVQIDKTAPDVIASAIKGTAPGFTPSSAYTENSWTNQDVKVSFQCTDSAGGSGVAAGSPNPASQTFDTEGEHTASSDCSDKAGNSDHVDFGVKIDRTAPSVTASAIKGTAPDFTDDSPYTENSWTNQDVKVSFECTDEGGSGVADGSPNPASKTYTDEGEHTASSDCSDNAGNSDHVDFGVKIDKTAPSVTASAVKGTAPDFTDGTPYTENSWTNQDVKVSFECTDEGGSGVAAGGPNPASTTYDTEGERTAGSDCSDNAGNSDHVDFGVKIDKTAPSVTASAIKGTAPGFTPSSAYTENSWTNQDVKVSFECTDEGGSGVAAGSPNPAIKVFTDEGEHTASSDCSDNAGNSDDVDFGVKIDRTAPSVTASAVKGTAPDFTDGTPYTENSWTNQDVKVSFECTDEGGSGVADGSPNPASKTYTDEGEHTASSDCSDNAGNSDDVDLGVKIDKTAPTIGDLGPAPATPNGDNDWYTTDVSNAFKASDGGSGLDAACVAAFPANGSGGHVQSKSTSTEGTSVTVDSDSCTDIAGNTRGPKTSAAFKIDKQKPSSEASSDDYENSSPFDVSYTRSDNLSGVAKVELWVKGPGDVGYSLYGTDSGAAIDGVFSFVPSSQGTYRFYTIARDKAGNDEAVQTAADTTTIVEDDQTVFDSIAPTVTVTEAIKGTAPDFNDATPYTEGSWTNKDVKVTFECTDNAGGSGVAAGSPNPASQTFDTEGEHTASSGCSDKAGNPDDVDFAVKIDKTAPTISNLGPTPASPNGSNSWYTSAVTNKFKATDGSSGLDATCLAAFPDNGSGDRIQSKSTASNEGSSITVSSDGCSDVAGNSAASINSAAFKLDLTDPSVAITSPANGSTTTSSSITVSGTASDTPSGLASVTVGSQTATSNVTVNNGQWTATVNLECGPAPNTITAMAKDVAGREKIHQIDVTRNCATGPAGLHARFLSPLDESVKSTTRIANKAKSGRVVPVQIELWSAGNRLTSTDVAEGDITLQVTKMQTCDPSASEIVETYAAAGASNTGSLFRWSGTKMIYNLDTGNKAYSFAVNSCYRLNVLYKGTTHISWAPSIVSPATSISTAADWWAYLQIVK